MPTRLTVAGWLNVWRRFDPSPADAVASKAYRWGALPFGCFLLMGSVLLPVVSWLTPDHGLNLPPLENARSVRFVVLGLALFLFVDGIGFVLRRRWALNAFLVYGIVGTLWHVAVGFLFANHEILRISPLINGLFLCGLWHVMRPAFRSPGEGFDATPFD